MVFTFSVNWTALLSILIRHCLTFVRSEYIIPTSPRISTCKALDLTFKMGPIGDVTSLTICTMLKSFGNGYHVGDILLVIDEGVETTEQADFMIKKGCSFLKFSLLYMKI